MPFQPGTSGNPSGRPPKNRALTEILRKTGARKVAIQQPDGTIKEIPGREALARMVWEVVTSGQVTLPDGTVKEVADFADWFAAVQFIYKHIDGPAPSNVDITTAGQPLIRVVFEDIPTDDGSDDRDSD
jgi:hypothetical protein